MQWRKGNAKFGKNIKKCTHFSSRVAWVNRSYFVGRQMLRFLDPQFISNHKKCLQGRGDAIFGWLVCSLSGISWYGWFVGGLYVVTGLAGLWVVSSYTANGSVLRKRCSESMLQIYWRKPMLKCDFNVHL